MESPQGIATASRPAPVGSGLSARHREWIAGYLFILPDAAGLLLFAGVPMLLSFALGFFDVNGFGGYQFIGLANYRRMFSDPLFLHSLRITFTYVVMLVPSLYVAGLALALAMQRGGTLTGVLRCMFFLPQMVSLVVVALLWHVLLVAKIGLVNRWLTPIGLGGISWLGDPRWALIAVVVISVWFLMGFYMLIFLGGLQDIPPEYYDAATMDGAGPIARFWYITLPLLRPTSFFVLLVSVVAAVAGVQGFDFIYVMTKGGPANSTSLILYYIYQQAFQYNEFGYATAMASFLVLLLMAVTLVLFLLTHGGRFNYD